MRFVVTVFVSFGIAALGIRCEAEDLGELRRFDLDGKVGFKNRSGEVIVPALYDDAGKFAHGLAAVNIGAKREFPGFKTGGKWGYVNETGKVVVPITLSSAAEFSDGLALVHDDAGMRFVDTTGNTVVQIPRDVASCGDFSEGLAPLRRSTRDGTWWTTAYIDKHGKCIIRVDGSGAEFHEELAAVSVRNQAIPAGHNMSHLSGFIDRSGKWIIAPTFAEVREFSSGLAAVRPKKTTVYGMGDSWGYIDKQGKLVIDLQFNEARSFTRGFALVHIGGQLHEVHDAPPFWDGGTWMIIDQKGNVLERSHRPINVEDFANNRLNRS